MSKKPEKIVLMDMDGSMADYDEAMQRELRKIMAPGERLPEDPFKAREDSPYWENRMSLIKRQTGFWLGLEPIQLGLGFYRYFLNRGYRVMVLTKGPGHTPSAWGEKLLWAREHMPEAQITITDDKSLTYGRVLYDDWPNHITAWLKRSPRGKVIIRDRQYNRSFIHPRVMRVYDHEHFDDETLYDRVDAFLNG